MKLARAVFVIALAIGAGCRARAPSMAMPPALAVVDDKGNSIDLHDAPGRAPITVICSDIFMLRTAATIFR